MRAVKDVLPLFKRVGSDRSVGLQFVKKDGRVLDVLLDAEVCPSIKDSCFAYAALRDSPDLRQWEQASTTIKALVQLTHVQCNLERVLFKEESDTPSTGRTAVREPSAPVLETGLTREVLGTLLELTQDISINLRALQRVQEDSLGATMEQQSELLLVAKSIDRTLADLADTVATAARESE